MFEEFEIHGSLLYTSILLLVYIIAAIGVIFAILTTVMVFGIIFENHWSDLKAWWS